MSQAELSPDFGERLRTARKDAGLSQEEFAGLMNVSRTTIQGWEQGRQRPEFGRLQHIAQHTRKPVSWFFASRPGPNVEHEFVRLALERMRTSQRELAEGIGYLEEWLSMTEDPPQMPF